MYSYHLRPRENKNSKGWQIVIEGEPDPITGKRNRKYKTVKGTKKQADAKAIELINELNNGGITKPSALKLKDWLIEWHSNYLPNIEYRTCESYLERMNHRIIPVLGNIQLKALQTTVIQKWVNTISTELAPKSVRNIFNILNASLKKSS